MLKLVHVASSSLTSESVSTYSAARGCFDGVITGRLDCLQFFTYKVQTLSLLGLANLCLCSCLRTGVILHPCIISAFINFLASK